MTDARTKIDLRTVAPSSRLAVATYASHLLRQDQAMDVTDEYDPVDLFIDFQRKADRFDWEYLERGPKVWRARITRVAEPSIVRMDAPVAAQAPAADESSCMAETVAP